MLRTIFIALLLVVASGCRHRERGVVVRAANGPVANLALGRTSETTAVALGIGRAEWPSVDHGYRVEDTTYYTRVFYDTQFRYDRYGALYDESQVVETGVWVR